MSTVIPNGQIRFLSGVPLENSYEDSLDFTTRDAQTSYFLSIQPVKTMVGATRVRDGVINVDCLSDTILTADYLMFQNTGFSNKWFYAFITNIEYVNNNMCHVTYEIDDIQTWMFDVQLKECFIEREHTATDKLYEHLVDEGIATSDYIISNTNSYNLTSTLTALVFTGAWVVSGAIARQAPRAWQGNLSSLGVLQYDVKTSGSWNTNEIQQLGRDLEELVEAQQADSVVEMVCFPTDFISQADTKYPTGHTLDFPSRTSLNGYTPKNNKMYNSPYCIYTLQASNGQKLVLQPELFTDDDENHSAVLEPDVSPTPAILATVGHYKGITPNYQYSIEFSGFPQVPFNVDGYKAWVAAGGLTKLQFNAGVDLAQSVVGIGANAITGNPAGMAGSMLEGGRSAFNAYIDLNVAKTLPASVRGALSSSPLLANGEAKFRTTYETIPKDIAISIDNYFTMFGYKVNKIGTPSRRNRPHYTFIKTRGAKVVGGAPADAIDRIQRIYDSGIRFWVNASEVGNYNVNNAPR